MFKTFNDFYVETSMTYDMDMQDYWFKKKKVVKLCNLCNTEFSTKRPAITKYCPDCQKKPRKLRENGR